MDIKKIFPRARAVKYATCPELFAFLAFSTAALAPLSAAAEFDTGNWEWRAEILATTSEGRAIFELPQEARASANLDLSDLRVIAGGRETSYVALPEAKPWEDTAVPAELLGVSSGGGTTTVIFKTNERGYAHNTITLAADGKNFKRNAEIYGSMDGRSWRLLNGQAVIFSERISGKNATTVSDLALPYPPTDEQFIKVVISDRGARPIGVSGGAVLRRAVLDVFPAAYDASFAATVDAETGSRDLIVDLGSYSFPHRRAVLSTSNENFGRAIVVYESDNRADWRQIGSAYVFSGSGKDFTGKNLQIIYPATNARYLKLSLVEGDAAPIRITGVMLFGEARLIAVPYESERKHYLYFGNSVAKRPDYGLADSRVLSAGGDREPLRLSVGAVAKNPGFMPLRGERLPLIFGWAIQELPLLLGALLLTLGFACYRIFIRR